MQIWNTQYLPQMFTYRQNSRVLQEMPFCACAIKICNLAHIYGRIATIPASYRKSWSANTMVTSDFWQEVEVRPFCARAIKKYAIWTIFMAESPKFLHSSAMDLWTRLWGRYHVPQNVFLVNNMVSQTLTLWHALHEYLIEKCFFDISIVRNLKTIRLHYIEILIYVIFWDVIFVTKSFPPDTFSGLKIYQKCFFGRGSAPDPTGGAYNAPQTP